LLCLGGRLNPVSMPHKKLILENIPQSRN